MEMTGMAGEGLKTGTSRALRGKFYFLFYFIYYYTNGHLKDNYGSTHSRNNNNDPNGDDRDGRGGA